MCISFLSVSLSVSLSQFLFFCFIDSDSVFGIGHSIRKLYATLVGCTTMEGTQLAPHFLTLPWPTHVLHFLSLIGSCLMSGSCFISALLCFRFLCVSILVALDLVLLSPSPLVPLVTITHH